MQQHAHPRRHSCHREAPGECPWPLEDWQVDLRFPLMNPSCLDHPCAKGPCLAHDPARHTGQPAAPNVLPLCNKSAHTHVHTGPEASKQKDCAFLHSSMMPLSLGGVGRGQGRAHHGAAQVASTRAFSASAAWPSGTRLAAHHILWQGCNCVQAHVLSCLVVACRLPCKGPATAHGETWGNLRGSASIPQVK